MPLRGRADSELAPGSGGARPAGAGPSAGGGTGTRVHGEAARTRVTRRPGHRVSLRLSELRTGDPIARRVNGTRHRKVRFWSVCPRRAPRSLLAEGRSPASRCSSFLHHRLLISAVLCDPSEFSSIFYPQHLEHRCPVSI